MLTLPPPSGLYVERAPVRHRRLSIGADDGRSARAGGTAGYIRASVERLSDHWCPESVPTQLLTPGELVAAEAVRTLGSLALMGVGRRAARQSASGARQSGIAVCRHIGFPLVCQRIGEQRAVSTTSMPSVTWHWCWCRTWPGEPIGPRPWAGCSMVLTSSPGSAPPGRRSLLMDLRVRIGVDIPTAASVAPARSRT